MKPNIDHTTLTTLLHYDHDSGEFTQKLKWWNREPGDKPGGVSPQGYWYIGVGGKQYPAHRLAWFYVHGTWPQGDIDHINRNRLDNRICNLREVSRSTNIHNTAARASSGVKNVSKTKSGNWEVRLRVNGVHHYLGRFANLSDAESAVTIARVKFGLP